MRPAWGGHRLLHPVLDRPLVVIVIVIAGLFFGQEAAEGELYAQIRGLLGEDGAKTGLLDD
jgi:hypothetical protein